MIAKLEKKRIVSLNHDLAQNLKLGELQQTLNELTTESHKYRAKHLGINTPIQICHPGQNNSCHFCHPGENIPCDFLTG